MENQTSLLEKLEALYQRAIKSSTPKLFFLSLLEYIELYDTNPTLKPIWKAIVALAKKDLKKLRDLEQKSYKEIKQVYREIKEFSDKNNITLAGVVENLKSFEAHEKGTLTSSDLPIKARYGYLSYALMSLVEAKNPDYLQFCRQYGTISDEYRIEKWHFSPSYNRWEELNQEIDRKKITKVWYSWDKLVLFYDVFQNYETKQKRNIKSNKLFDIWGLSMLFQEIKDILNEKTEPNRQIRHFKHEDYLLHLERVHLFTKEALIEVNKKIQAQQKKQNWTYDQAGGMFCINDKIAQFKKNSLRGKILELITKNDRNKTKIWDWNELYETIEETEVGKEYQSKVYYACKGINEHIALETGVTDFLVVTTKNICINPSYLS